MLSKHYKSTEVDSRTWLHVPSGTPWSTTEDTRNFISSGSKIVKGVRQRQYDALIIERTIDFVLGPSTTLYGPFLKHCTLPNKAMETITGLVQTSSEATRS